MLYLVRKKKTLFLVTLMNGKIKLSTKYIMLSDEKSKVGTKAR